MTDDQTRRVEIDRSFYVALMRGGSIYAFPKVENISVSQRIAITEMKRGPQTLTFDKTITLEPGFYNFNILTGEITPADQPPPQTGSSASQQR